MNAPGQQDQALAQMLAAAAAQNWQGGAPSNPRMGGAVNMRPGGGMTGQQQLLPGMQQQSPGAPPGPASHGMAFSGPPGGQAPGAVGGMPSHPTGMKAGMPQLHQQQPPQQQHLQQQQMQQQPPQQHHQQQQQQQWLHGGAGAGPLQQSPQMQQSPHQMHQQMLGQGASAGGPLQPPQMQQSQPSLMQQQPPQGQPGQSLQQPGMPQMQQPGQGGQPPNMSMQAEAARTPADQSVGQPGDAKADSSPDGKFSVGMKVEAQCVGWGPEFYPGTIREFLSDGELQILWDGDEPSISNVPPHLVRPREEAKTEEKPSDLPAATTDNSSADASSNGTSTGQVPNSLPPLAQQPQTMQTSPPVAAPDSGNESHGQKHARDEVTPSSGTAPEVVAASILSSVRSYRYDLAPGDEITAPLSNLRRRVEAEISDGLQVTISLHIVRDPDAGMPVAPISALVTPSKHAVTPNGNNGNAASNPQMTGEPPFSGNQQNQQMPGKSPVNSLQAPSHPNAPPQTRNEATGSVGTTGMMNNGAPNASMPSMPSLPNIAPIPQLQPIPGMQLNSMGAGPLAPPPGMSQPQMMGMQQHQQQGMQQQGMHHPHAGRQWEQGRVGSGMLGVAGSGQLQ